MKGSIHDHLEELSISLIDDKQRVKVQFISVYFILAVVSSFMTVVNVFTQRYALMLSTLLFAVANALNLILSARSDSGRRFAAVLFSAEITALFVFFIVSGEPEGFSAIWVCMLPASGLLLFGKKRGTILCAVEFVMMMFFFHVPMGRALLQYPYTESFLLRFPMLYIAFFSVAYFLETIRAATYDALQKSRKQYLHLCSHDALTEVYNRYGFNEYMDALLSAPREKSIALLILDIDHFKNVNDCYGHIVGDVVLKEIASLLTQVDSENSVVCRWGGEEFAVIFNDATHCKSISERILHEIRALEVPSGENTIKVTASIGVVTVPPFTSASAADLVIQADNCLYEAKEAGRDHIVSAEFHTSKQPNGI